MNYHRFLIAAFACAACLSVSAGAQADNSGQGLSMDQIHAALSQGGATSVGAVAPFRGNALPSAYAVTFHQGSGAGASPPPGVYSAGSTNQVLNASDAMIAPSANPDLVVGSISFGGVSALPPPPPPPPPPVTVVQD